MSRDFLFSEGGDERMARALASLRSGNGVIVVDDYDRENEGDLIYPAQTLTEEQMALLIRRCSGIVCLCITAEKAATLDLSPMVANNTSRYGTAFTVTIEAAEGVTTGVSARDRVRTIRAATAEDAKPDDLHRPGHVFPLVARPGGVLERGGHTEATVDLMRLSGLSPAGVLCELTNDDGTMSRRPQIEDFAKRHGLPILAVKDVIGYRLAADRKAC